jgi:hypothetical protein
MDEDAKRALEVPSVEDKELDPDRSSALRLADGASEAASSA